MTSKKRREKSRAKCMKTIGKNSTQFWFDRNRKEDAEGEELIC